MKKVITSISTVLLVAAVTIAGALSVRADDAADVANKKLNELFPDSVVAKGKGVEVKRSQVEDAFIAFKAASNARQQTVPDSQRAVVESNLVQRLIVTQLLISRATADEKAKAKEKAEKFLGEQKARFPSEELFTQQVRASGMTMDQFRARVTEQMTCDAVIEREVKSKIATTDADVKKFYDDNPNNWEVPEKVRAAHILIGTLDKASNQPLPADQKKEKEDLIKKIRERAVGGEDFGKLAKEFSEDPGSKDKGGEYTFPRGQMVKEFEAAAFSMQTNQISDVVETRFGYHIIKLLEKFPAQKMDFEKVKSDIKEYLTSKETQTQLPAFFEKMQKEAGVEIIGMGNGPAATAPATNAAPAAASGAKSK